MNSHHVSRTAAAPELLLQAYAALEGMMAWLLRGSFYAHPDDRHDDAATKDAVISVTALDAAQVQRGRLRVTVFVPDMDNSGATLVADGQRLALVADGQRLADVAAALTRLAVRTLGENMPDWGFTLAEAPHAGRVSGREEHYVAAAVDMQRRAAAYTTDTP